MAVPPLTANSKVCPRGHGLVSYFLFLSDP
jgi:hypothetical protein